MVFALKVKAMAVLSGNPFYPGIDPITRGGLLNPGSRIYVDLMSQAVELRVERNSEIQTTQPAYFSAYRSVKMARDAEGVLTLQFHTEGEPLIFTAQDHTEFVDAFYRIAQDRANKIVILTGTAGQFIPGIDFSSFGNVADPEVWSQVHDEGVQILENLANIRVLVIAAIEGQANVHSEYALMADVIVASEGATFNDLPHFAGGIVPGDGIFTTLELSRGSRKSRGFPLKSTAAECTHRVRMGSSRRGCDKWKGAASRARARLALPENSGSHTPQHPRALHSTLKGANRTRSWLRSLARRSLSNGACQINADQSLSSPAFKKELLCL